MAHPPRVTITPHPIPSLRFVDVEARHDDDGRGGRLTIHLDELRLLPLAIARAIEAHDRERRAA